MFNLLQHRVGQAVVVGITETKAHWQAIGMRHTSGRHHVGRTRADRRRGNHDLPPQLCLAIADRGKRHGLFVLAAPRWQNVLNLFQRLR